MMIFSKAL